MDSCVHIFRIAQNSLILLFIDDDELVPKCQIGTLRDTEVFEVTKMPVSKLLI